jgi:hypothetical protein
MPGALGQLSHKKCCEAETIIKKLAHVSVMICNAQFIY